ncbi:uncharacterized protein PV09_08897 [Verruconis gallopava]|uniref:Rho-GAP domain-containing protein n=1 Tax=Verruconis gallopava TaxID=253628 RepID=A0A0D1ZYG9_9PEZI|nr:uncharacterized protein PV09_08897 [Verruconis gallopava]KIV99477.1 hypothetical protein PV09_08897 [Verruconis gallopava]
MSSSMRGGLTARARNGEPTPTLQTNTDEPMSSKRDLKSWWKNFSRGDKKREEDKANQPTGIFGVPLQTSVRYANVAISLQDSEGNSYVYGYVPIVVAKCGVFLKEKATDVEGIFRLSGSEKRIKELKEAFNSPDRYGKGLDWTGYTVHDAANILRRYFNQLPEPIIPLEFYDRFRDPLRNHQSQAVGQIEGQSPAVGDFDHQATIRIYQQLITELPPLNRQLLLYILDLLAVFASKSDLNKMTTPNLAAIFQPGILSHPSHDMAPPEYRLSQDVLIFLIENQDHFLIGMPGTGADEKTKADVESGPPTPSVGRAPKSVLGRSSSGASKYSGVRRSVSVSSKQSASIAPSPISPSPHTPHTPTAAGVHRSNTVPSKHSPRSAPTRFHRDAPSEPSSLVPTPMYTPAEIPGAYPTIGEAPTENATPKIDAPPAPAIMSPSQPQPADAPIPVPKETATSNTETHDPQQRPDAIEIPAQARTMSIPPGQETPTGSSRLAAIFGAGGSKPGTPGAEGRKPNKLQKKRMPGSSNPSAQSSSHSLTDASNTEQMSVAPSVTSNMPLLQGQSSVQQTPTNATFLQPPSAENTPVKPNPSPGLKAEPPMSPANSYRSHSEFTEGELDDVQPLDNQGAPDVTSDKETDQADSGKKRGFWRKKGESVSYAPQNPSSNVDAQRSRSSVLSGGDSNRKSLTLDRNATLSDPESDSHRNSKPIAWFKGKLAERAERKEEKDRLKQEAKEEKERLKQEAKEEKDRLKQEAKEEKARARAAHASGDFGAQFNHSIDAISESFGGEQSVRAASTAATAAANTPSSGFDHPPTGGLRSPPAAEVPQRGQSMDIRRNGRSMDVPREQLMQPKQSMDGVLKSSQDFAPAAVTAATAAAKSEAPSASVSAMSDSTKQPDEKTNAQDSREGATASQAAQLAASSAPKAS